MHLKSLTHPELVFSDLECVDRPTLFRSLAKRLVRAGHFSDADELYDKLWERELLGSTGIGANVAVPHCKMADTDRVVVAVALLREGIDFNAIDDKPVHLVFLVISPEDQPAAHLHCLAAISKWIKADNHVERILRAEDPPAVFGLLSE